MFISFCSREIFVVGLSNVNVKLVHRVLKELSQCIYFVY